MTGAWGPALDSSDVEAAVKAHLEHWMEAMIEYVRREKDPAGELWPAREDGPPVAPIREFGVSHADAAAQKWPEDQLPMLIIQSPGEEKDPVVEEDGNVSAQFAVLVSAVATSVTMEDAKQLARLYASAARLAMVFNPQLDAGTGKHFASSLELGRERNGQVRRGVEGERNLMICTHPYLIGVPTILRLADGPLELPEDPTAEPSERPRVKAGGGSVKVEALTSGGFFDSQS
jgi:hypothetical protein